MPPFAHAGKEAHTYRLIVALLEPFTLLALLMLVCLVCLWMKGRAIARRSLVWLTILIAALCIVSLLPTAVLLSGTLEWSYPPLASRPDDVQAIVVLGGGVNEPAVPGQAAELSVDTLYRCLGALRLYRDGPPCLLILSGGKVRAERTTPPVSEAMREFLLSAGVDEGDIIVENKSRTTFENAVHVAEILHQRKLERVLLVTDAIHLKRSQWCFAARGIDVIPAGVDYSALDFEWSLVNVLPNPKAAHQVERVAHEWLGIVWYWWQGRFAAESE